MTNVLIIHHIISKEYADNVKSYLQKLEKFKIILLDDTLAKDKLSVISKIIQSCDILVILASPELQKIKELMEIVYYAKDLKKSLYSLNFYSTYKPFGSLGAISVSSNNGVIQLDKLINFEAVMNDLIESFMTNINQINSDREFCLRPSSAPENLIYSTENSCHVLILYHKNQIETADLIKSGISSDEIKCLIEDPSNSNKTLLKQAQVLLIILSDDFEKSYNCNTIVDAARSLGKKIIPIVIQKGYKANGWLNLAIAGKVFYRIIDKNHAYNKKYDSTPMNDLKIGILHALEYKSTQEERENAMINSIQKELENAKKKLGDKWPPKNRERKFMDEKPVKIVLSEPKATNEFLYTNYTITRVNFSLPKELFDSNGIPVRNKFDIMISYQWDKQDLVRNVYMNLSMRNISSWFDIWGNMQGNCYESMSTAIECSKVILVFLNGKYFSSENCKLEFKYAIYRGKPFIFIITEPNLKIENWLEPYYSDYPKFEIFDEQMCGLPINGVPKLDVISQAIREIGQAQSDNSNFELSLKIIEMKNMLENALDDIAELTGTVRFKTCTRCNKTYDDLNLNGCKRHLAYFLDGDLLEPSWVCCRQQKKDSIGCSDTTHIDVTREWVCDPDYGTYSWNPA